LARRRRILLQCRSCLIGPKLTSRWRADECLLSGAKRTSFRKVRAKNKTRYRQKTRMGFETIPYGFRRDTAPSRKTPLRYRHSTRERATRYRYRYTTSLPVGGSDPRSLSEAPANTGASFYVTQIFCRNFWSGSGREERFSAPSTFAGALPGRMDRTQLRKACFPLTQGSPLARVRRSAGRMVNPIKRASVDSLASLARSQEIRPLKWRPLSLYGDETAPSRKEPSLRGKLHSEAGNNIDLDQIGELQPKSGLIMLPVVTR
jgi:hypothetical protein